ncbi:MAG TPA: HNH endonuclease [Mucilaginibacter sp.]|nr:HNH endonuclease [Mucilaginibacter sp.]
MEAAGPHFILYSFESAVVEFNAFLNVYYPVKIMIPPDVGISNLKPVSERTCRFCQRSSPEVSFDKLAHIIPESLGNKHLVSDFECDDCNGKFSLLETSFSGWLGAIKTLAGTRGKHSVPKFKPANQTIEAKKVTFLNTPATKISTGKASEGTVKLDKESGEVVFKFKKDGYTPIKAYKSLLKIALSIIGPEERNHYRPAFEFLTGPDDNAVFQLFAKVICLELPLSHAAAKPYGSLYQKIEPLAKYPLHYFTLHYEHFIYGFPVPLNLVDYTKGCYANNSIQAIYAPPVMLWQPDKKDTFFSHTEDFSSSEKKSNEEQTISFNLSPEHLKKLTAVDPKTGEFKDGELSGPELASLLILSEQVTLQKGQTFDVP